VVDIIHGEPIVTQEVTDTVEEHHEKKTKRPRVKRTVEKS